MNGAAYHPKRNSFQLLRLVLALAVVFTHSYSTVQGRTPLSALTGGSISGGQLAVDGFFFISGFLICQSAMRGRNPFCFLWNRVVRLWPAMTCALVFTALLIGGLSYAGGYEEYLRLGEEGPFYYIRHWLTLCVKQEPWNIAGVFAKNPNAGVNVSLWTVKHEVSLYLVMALLMLLTLSRRRWIYPAIALLHAVVYALRIGWGIQLYHIPRVEAWVLNTWNYTHTWHEGLYFWLGATVYAYRDVIPRRRSLALCALGLLALGVVLRVVPWVQPVAWSYLVYYIAASPACASFSAMPDLSFGIYVYSYPIQQLLVQVKPTLHPVLNTGLTLVLVLPIALLSWRYIEKPALRLKAREKGTAAYAPPASGNAQ